MSTAADFCRRVYTAINERDESVVEELLAPDFDLRTTVEQHEGHMGARDWIREVDQALENYRADLLDVEEVGGHVVATVRQTGRGRASGVEVDHRFTHVWTLREGKAVRMEAFTDRDEALRRAAEQG